MQVLRAVHVPPFRQLKVHFKSEFPQFGPLNPDGHKHVLIPVHVPPFKQLGLQENIDPQFFPLNPV
jgi:hypothetical protein